MSRLRGNIRSNRLIFGSAAPSQPPAARTAGGKEKTPQKTPSRCADAGRQGGCQTVGALLEHRRFEAIDHRLYLFVLMHDLN
ncbi:protein of unknown function [Methylocella tundrae]|uniref:Uncharacterized protein n=1 Tax=Methylocella tundrae TaxID=227605 RepID=A0A4U8YUJ2_METTU|nr:protein of unknown function [Methylocella tundrae]